MITYKSLCTKGADRAHYVINTALECCYRLGEQSAVEYDLKENICGVCPFGIDNGQGYDCGMQGTEFVRDAEPTITEADAVHSPTHYTSGGLELECKACKIDLDELRKEQHEHDISIR